MAKWSLAILQNSSVCKRDYWKEKWYNIKGIEK